MILATTVSPKVATYEGDNGPTSQLLDEDVCMLTFGSDLTLAVLLVGSTILYYWHLYNIMQRNKSKSGSYWKD
jgi:hypothetical protein